MRHIKRFIIFILTCAILILITTAEKNEASPAELYVLSTQGEIDHYPTFEECLTAATHVLFATYKGTYLNIEGAIEYKFRIYRTLKGKKVSSIIYVPDTLLGWSGLRRIEPPFKKGESYILITRRTTCLFYEHDRYYQARGCIMPLNDLKSSKLAGGIDKLSNFNFNEYATEAGIAHYISKIVSRPEAQQANEYQIGSFTESKKLSEIIEYSQYIFKVRVNKVTFYESPSTSEVADCEVIEQIYGEPRTQTQEKPLKIELIIGTVKPGKEYILLLNKGVMDSIPYQLSSRRSVRRVSEYKRIMRMLEGA